MFAMYYAYDICPKCRNKFFERKEAKENEHDFDVYSDTCCEKCGEGLVLACVGKKKIDDTIYRITFRATESNEIFLNTLCEVNGSDLRTEKDKLADEKNIVLEGDAVHTFLNMDSLTGAAISYEVDPDFPFLRFGNYAVCLCPTCGSKTVVKTEEMQDVEDYMLQGFFCEKCNEWVMHCSISKLALDNAVYCLKFVLEEENDVKIEKIKRLVESLPSKLENGQIIISDKAEEIYELLQHLKAEQISYEIVPSFPHKVTAYKEVTEEDLKEILELVYN